MTLNANHAYHILANDLLNRARDVASEGKVFGTKVPLALLCDLTDADECDALVEMHRLGLIQLRRADLVAAWDLQFGRDVMDKSQLRHLNSEWHAVTLRDSDAAALGIRF